MNPQGNRRLERSIKSFPTAQEPNSAPPKESGLKHTLSDVPKIRDFGAALSTQSEDQIPDLSGRPASAQLHVSASETLKRGGQDNGSDNIRLTSPRSHHDIREARSAQSETYQRSRRPPKQYWNGSAENHLEEEVNSKCHLATLEPKPELNGDFRQRLDSAGGSATSSDCETSEEASGHGEDETGATSHDGADSTYMPNPSDRNGFPGGTSPVRHLDRLSAQAHPGRAEDQTRQRPASDENARDQSLDGPRQRSKDIDHELPSRPPCSSEVRSPRQRAELFHTAPAGPQTTSSQSLDPLKRPAKEEETSLSFRSYLFSELNPEPLKQTIDFWNQTERQRVYNAIAHVPYQLERLLWYSMLICCDSFLAVFTVLPIRFVRAIHSTMLVDNHYGHKRVKLQGQQLLDILCVIIFTATLIFLNSLDAGAIYFWMKDMTQEFLKLQVIYTAVEIFDKITCSFTVDSLEALSGTCTLFTKSPNKRYHLAHLISDFLVTATLVLLHAMILLCQGMAFSVAMNSKRNQALITLMIATNFVEMKGTIFKRFDTNKLFTVTCQDVVERFHLGLAMLFVMAEEMDNTSSWWPNMGLLWKCTQIFLAEIVIDVTKHAVLGKFNEIRPGVYREYTRDICDKVLSNHSNNIHKVICFEPFAPAALFMRIALTLIASNKLWSVSYPGIILRSLLCLLVWAALCGFKIVLGFWLKGAATAYLRHFEQLQKRQAAAKQAMLMGRSNMNADLSKLSKKES